MKTSRFILALSAILLFTIPSALAQNTRVDSTETIPYFTFYTLDQQRFTKDSFDTERTKFILYFNSECDHCQKQGKWLAKGISKHPSTFEKLEMVFVSYEEMISIKSYRDKFSFTESNITFLQDTRLTFSDKFKVETFPSILIYSKDGILIQKFEGEQKVEEFIHLLK